MHRCVHTLLLGLAIVTCFESRADHRCVFLKKHKIQEKVVEHTVPRNPRKVNLQDDFVSDWPDMSKVYFF